MPQSKTFPDGSSLPRIYSTTLVQRMAMPQAELEALWREYREFWYPAVHAGIESTPVFDNALDAEYQADWLEDREGDFR